MKNLQNYYYMIWADGLQRPRYYHPYETMWKFKTFFYITFSEALYFAGIASWLKLFNILDLLIDIKPTETKIDGFLSFAVSFWLPFIIIDYFLIFWKGRYKKIMKRYPLNINKPKYALRYTITSIVFIIISLVTYEIVRNN